VDQPPRRALVKLEGWHYIVECRWRKELADVRQLDGLLGQVQRSGKQTMGMFLSIEGWSKNVLPLLRQNPDKCIFLMDGYDLRCALALEADLRRLLMAKLACLSLEGSLIRERKRFRNSTAIESITLVQCPTNS